MKYFLVFLISLIVSSCGEPTDPRVGTDISDLTLKDFSSKNVSLDKFKGKTTVINIWASWCTPCIKEMPSLMKLQDNYQVILINVDSKAGVAAKTLKKYNFTPKISLFDANGTTVRNKLSAMRLPQTFITDKNLIIKGVEMGDKDWNSDEMLNKISHYINQ